MSPIRDMAMKEPLVDTVEPHSIATQPCQLFVRTATSAATSTTTITTSAPPL
jgi:hypothetical protein